MILLRKIILICLIALFAINLAAQLQVPEKKRKADSLKYILNTRELPPLEEFAILDTINIYISDDLNGCIARGLRMLEIMENEKVDNQEKKCGIIFGTGMCYMLIGEYEPALNYLNTALLMSKENEDRYTESRVIVNIGNTYSLQGKYVMALDYYLQALKLCDKDSKNNYFDLTNYSRALGNIAETYYMMGNHSQALHYAEYFFKINSEIYKNHIFAQVFYIMASVYLHRNELDKAEENALKSFECADGLNYIYQGFSTEALAKIYIRRGDYDKAMEYARESLYYADELGDPATHAKAYNVLSEVYIAQKQYNQAEAVAAKAMETNPVAIDTEPNLAYNIAMANIHLGNKEKADSFLRKYNEIISRNNDKNFSETLTSMEVQFETKKKEIYIAALEKENRLYIWLVLIGIVTLLALSGLLFYSYRDNVQKRKLAKQKREIAEQECEIAKQQIKQLEQDKQLIAIRSILKGENDTCVRIARDLHDGLGGLLTAVKLNLNPCSVDKSDVCFNNALEILDLSVVELRRIAINLMPQSLVSYGLKTAIEDFCNKIPIVHFSYIGENSRLNSLLEINIYRCVLELINNAMKYASASNINVQLIVDNGLLSLSVHDDGIGFDPETHKSGSGLKNLRFRTAAFNGKMNIYSSPKKGTEVSIEIENINDLKI
jgi:signal transduction histidine kinase